MALSAQAFLDIDINSMFEAGTLLEGLSGEGVIWLCQERAKHPQRGTEVAVFGLYFMDIEIGRIRGELLKNNTIDWKQII